MRRGEVSALAVLVIGALAGCDRYVEIGAKVADFLPPEGGPGGEGTDATAGAEGGERADAAPPDTSGNDAGTTDGSSTIVWSTGAESGDFSDWDRDGPAVGGVNPRLVQLSVSNERARTGARALKIGFDSSDGVDHQADLYHRAEAGPAYYGAWYFIEEAHAPKTFWTLFYFFYETEAGNSATRHALWDVNLNKVTLYFYDEHTLRPVDAVPQKPFPVGQWVHVEAYFAYEPPKNGHIKVWLDGDVILDVKDLGAAPGDYLYWGIGSDTNGLTPPACTMYIDDVTISTSRLGP